MVLGLAAGASSFPGYAVKCGNFKFELITIIQGTLKTPCGGSALALVPGVALE